MRGKCLCCSARGLTPFALAPIDRASPSAPAAGNGRGPYAYGRWIMKVRSSLKSLKSRHRDCKLVRRKGRIFVINKTDPRFKAKQG